MEFILLSVPHNVCNPNDDPDKHTCDTIAEDTANYICDILSGAQIPFVMLLGDVNREILDLNRKRSRDSGFREDLRKEFKKQPVIHLDIHSFPEGDKDFKDVDIAIGTDRADIEEHLKDLADYLASKGVDSLAVGNLEADIVKEAKQHGVSSYLLEFNEGLTDVCRYWICCEIIDFLSTIITV